MVDLPDGCMGARVGRMDREVMAEVSGWQGEG